MIAATGSHLLHAIVIGAWAVVTVAIFVLRRPAATAGETESSAEPAGIDSVASPRLAGIAQCASISFLSAAAIHVAVLPAHVRESWLYGVFFATAAAAQLTLAVAVLVRPSRSVLLAGAAGSAVVVGLWVVTRTLGVPLRSSAGTTEPVGTLDLLASLAESASFLYCIALVRERAIAPAWRWQTWTWARRCAVPAVVALVYVTALGYPPA